MCYHICNVLKIYVKPEVTLALIGATFLVVRWVLDLCNEEEAVSRKMN